MNGVHETATAIGPKTRVFRSTSRETEGSPRLELLAGDIAMPLILNTATMMNALSLQPTRGAELE